jgi:hypothetical protein
MFIPISDDAPPMAARVPPARLLPKLDRVRSNLHRWKSSEWAIFWGIVPLLLLVVYALPQPVRDDYFILNTLSPWRLQTWFLSSYTHSQLYPHLAGNLAFYFVLLLMIFAFEDNRRRFWLAASFSFCIVPFISSFLTIVFWGLLGRNTVGQGFSAIDGAFLAYAMFIFVIWGIGDTLVDFDHPEYFTGSTNRYNFLKILLGILLALIVVMGIWFGVFMDLGGSVSNGIVHFGGFIASLTLLLIIDTKTEKRRYFDRLLGTSILVGIFWYAFYLLIFIHFVKGG